MSVPGWPAGMANLDAPVKRHLRIVVQTTRLRRKQARDDGRRTPLLNLATGDTGQQIKALGRAQISDCIRPAASPDINSLPAGARLDSFSLNK